MINLHKKYCKETFFDNRLIKFEPVYKNDFNFAYDIVDVIAANEPERRAMLWCNERGDEKVITFGDMKRESDRAANMLRSLGVKKGDAVMLILKRHYEFWFMILALHKLGAIAAPAYNLLSSKDLVYRFNSASIKGVICTTEGDITRQVEKALPDCKTVEFKMSVRGKRDGWLNFNSLICEQSDEFERIKTEVSDCMLLYFTSGTTGMPKMVFHDYTYPLGHIVTAKYWHNVIPDGLHFTISDTGWLKSMWGKLYGQWFMGAGIFVYDFDRFVSADILSLFKKYNITTFCAPPTMYRFFIKEDINKYDLSSLKNATVAGEALNPEVYNQFLKATGLGLMEGFGQSETTPIILNMAGDSSKIGSMGKSSPAYEVDLVDSNGNSVEPGIVGEIVVRTDNGKPCGMFCGYYRDEERTESVWNNNVYHTGDTAYKDEDGYFWYVGRVDDIIKSSGYRIGPFEIESVLMELPYVLECAATGTPDPVRGQAIKATVVLAKGYKPSDELKKDIQDYVKRQTAPYKYPRVVEFVDKLPKTISGKIRRIEIREQDK